MDIGMVSAAASSSGIGASELLLGSEKGREPSIEGRGGMLGLRGA